MPNLKIIKKIQNKKIISLKYQHGFMKYFKNTSWLLFDKIFRMVVGLFIGVWFARYLGPEQYGVFSYAQAFVGLFGAFATLGLDTILVRELVNKTNDSSILLGTAFILKLFGALVVLLILTIIVWLSKGDYVTNILILLIASTTIFQSFNVIVLYFESKVMSKYVAYVGICSFIISSLLKISLILFSAPLIAFAGVLLFDSIFMAGGLLYFYIAQQSEFKIRYYKCKLTVAVGLLKSSWPLMLSSLVISVYMKIDQVMLKYLLGSSAVGQYAVAVKLISIWYFIPVIISSSLFPAIINAKQKCALLYHKRVQKLYILMTWSALAISLPVILFRTSIVSLLYGQQYNQAANVLMIYAWASIFVFLGVASSKWLILENLQHLDFLRTFCGMITNIILNILLIPKYGINGAAIATLISQFTAAYMFDLFTRATREAFWMKTNSLFPYFYILKTVKSILPR